MRIFSLLTMATIVCWVMHARADEEKLVSEAQPAAEAWLQLVDAGKYAEAWEHAAPIVQMAVTKPDFEKAMNVARAPLGSLKSRKVKAATFTKTLPGAPDGEYVVIQYETQFENKASAVETVTPQRIAGKWKVSGYYIK